MQSVSETVRTGKCLTRDYRVIKAKPDPPHPTGQPTDGDRPSVLVYTDSTMAYSGSLVYCATLGGAFDIDQLLMTSRSSIALLIDQGKAYY